VRIDRHNLKFQKVIILLMLSLLSLSIVGCSQSERDIRIVPISNQYVLALSADDIVQVMRRAGFSDMQIWEHGTALREGLARSGAVQIRMNGRVEAIFAINGSDVYISTGTRGYFIYNVNTGWVTGR
jgi:hypothetical protein